MIEKIILKQPRSLDIYFLFSTICTIFSWTVKYKKTQLFNLNIIHLYIYVFIKIHVYYINCV
jgi:hypothetical protein